MERRSFLARYARSPWGICSAFVALGAGAAALALGAGSLAAAGALVLTAGAGLALGLATGIAQRAALAESDRESSRRAASRMAAVKDARSRLAALRLPAGPVAAARDLVVLEAGRLDETFARSGAYDPEAAQSAIDALGLADAWMRERDEAATERRFDLPDAKPFPRAEERTAEALRAAASLIASRRAAAAGEIPPADVAAIEEELR